MAPGLIDAGLALTAGRLDDALRSLDQTLQDGSAAKPSNATRLLRLLRLFAKHGAGERLLAWLDETGHGERIAPVRAAFDAYLHGEPRLRDVNPETRGAADRLYRWLTSNRPSEPGALWPGPGTSELDTRKKPRKPRRRARS
jgi:hypothetical protein